MKLYFDHGELFKLLTQFLSILSALAGVDHESGQETIGRTSGEATTPGPPGVIEDIINAEADARAVARRMQMMQAVYERNQAQNRNGPSILGRVASGVRALGGLSSIAGAAEAARRHFHGQDLVATTSGEASVPGPKTQGVKQRKLKKAVKAIEGFRSTSAKGPSGPARKSAATFTIDNHPAMTAGMVQTGTPVVQNNPDGSVTVRHAQLIQNILMPSTGTAYTTLLSSAINPGLSNPENRSLGPWITEISKQFESYSVEHLQFRWQPSAAATDRGIIGMALDYDVSDTVPPDFQSISAYVGSSFANVSEPFSIAANPKLTVPSGRKLLRPDNNFSGDPRLFDFARLLIVGEGLNLGAGTILGTVWAVYTIHLKAPHVGLSSMNLNPPRAVFSLTPTTLANAVGSTALVLAASTTRLTGFDTPGTGQITIPRGAWNYRLMCRYNYTVFSGTNLTNHEIQLTAPSDGLWQNYYGLSSGGANVAPRRLALHVDLTNGVAFTASGFLEGVVVNPDSTPVVITLFHQCVATVGTTITNLLGGTITFSPVD